MSYVRITREEFENFLTGYAEVSKELPGGDLRLQMPFISKLPAAITGNAKEIIYAIPVYKVGNSGSIAVIIYSAIDKKTNKGRDSGKDAMRTILMYNSYEDMGLYPLAKTIRTHRTPGWEKRLEKKMNGLISKAPKKPLLCTNGHPMLLRKNKVKKNYFYGCSKFPNCKYTMGLEYAEMVMGKSQ